MMGNIEMGTVEEMREEIRVWFAAEGALRADGWVSMGDFIDDWRGRMSRGQALSDIRILVKRGQLEKRVDYDQVRPANSPGGPGPTVWVRAVLP